MELGGSIVESLRDKCILVTGSTGFLAKIFVEKVLRVQPEVKKLFLILRAPDAKSASLRFRTEIVGKELFNKLRDAHGESGFESFVSSKLFPVAGDIVEEDFGIEDQSLLETMRREIDVVVNVAATTNFNERYDVALGVNVLGAKHAMEFAKKCPKIEMLLHVSTAYVAGSREGLQLEKKFGMGETLNGTKGLDIDGELSLAKQALEDIRSSTTNEREETSAMRDLGMERAQYFGWPNAYVFTKSMAEMLLGHMRGDLPLVIIRPTIITTIFSDPLPGWMEGGARTIDSVIIGYAKGKLPCFLGDLDLIMDVIPGDMVVNAMIVAAAAHLNKSSAPTEEQIYHVGSSARNPVKYAALLDSCHRYFTANPQVGRDGRTITARRIPVINSMDKFRNYMNLRHGLPLEGLRLLNLVSFNAFSRRYHELRRKFNFVMRLAELYAPFALFKGSFDDTNSKSLGKRVLLQANNAEVVKTLWFDPKSIDWDQYFMGIHIPGILKHVMK